MNLPKLAGAMRALAVTAAMALIASLVATPSYAADKVAPKGDPKTEAEKIAKGMEMAPAIITASKVNCDVANAHWVGNVAGKDAKGAVYEIACKAGPGFIITALSETEVKDPFTCNVLAKLNAADPKSPLCTLPENLPEYKWMTPVVQKFVPACEVGAARLIGTTTSAPVMDRYEVGCKAGAGGVLDYPHLGTTANPEFKNCLIMADSNSACTLTTKQQIIDSMKPLAAQADAKCQVTDARFAGYSKDNDLFFYEFGCATPPGFMVAAKADGSFDRMVTCAAAMGLGGCTLTDAGVIAADANSQYNAILKAAGFPCTVSEYNIVGTQENTKRDYVEFKCPEQPAGLIGFVPQPGSTAATRISDCFIDQTTRKSCTLTTPDDLLKIVDKLIKIAKPDKGCDIKEVRYIGESDGVEGAVIAEIACVNKRGYIIVIAPDRKSLTDAVPCGIAKTHKSEQQCEIAGNGTYTSGD